MVKSSPIAKTAHDKIKKRVGIILNCVITERMTIVLYDPLEMMENVLSKCQGNLICDQQSREMMQQRLIVTLICLKFELMS